MTHASNPLFMVKSQSSVALLQTEQGLMRQSFSGLELAEETLIS
jgi:hypothetical protein